MAEREPVLKLDALAQAIAKERIASHKFTIAVDEEMGAFFSRQIRMPNVVIDRSPASYRQHEEGFNNG